MHGLNSPCEGCPKRVVGCRTDCGPWKEFEAEAAARREAGRVRFEEQKQYYNYRFDGISKTLRRKHQNRRK
jgi:hypothetical protein